jgi:PadR family transcriptional regulator PadR
MVRTDQNSLTSAKKGSADLLILALVDERPRHGYDIAQLIDGRSGGRLQFTLASLYETLYRLEDGAQIRGRWIERAGQRRRRYYRITPAGRKLLAARRKDWARFISVLTEIAGIKPA